MKTYQEEGYGCVDVLESLHWLPVKYRILFKLLLLIYKWLTPGYLICLVMSVNVGVKRDLSIRVSCRLQRLDLSPRGKGVSVSLLQQNEINYLLTLNQH